MRAPEFWRHDGWAARALAPLAIVYDSLGALRQARARPVRVARPVVCVGNLTAGGSGKTPTVLALAALCAEHECQAHVLTRGHGGRLSGPVRVDPRAHTVAEVGDEALLLAAAAPTWLARDRVAGAEAAIAAGADLILMDDGFQNPHLAKDLSLLVLDTHVGLGNGRVHPAGPLRESARRGCARADALIRITVEGDTACAPFRAPPGLAELRARLVPTPASQRWRGRRVFAFAGIGRPEKLSASLRALGAEVVGARGFADHHVYDGDDIMALHDAAVALDATAVTTRKDAVRLPPEALKLIAVLDVMLLFEDADALLVLLAPALGDG